MTLKQKAVELVDKYAHTKVFVAIKTGNIFKEHYTYISTESSKQCAIIACDEMLEALEPWKNSYMGRQQIEYIQEVKTEIQAL